MTILLEMQAGQIQFLDACDLLRRKRLCRRLRKAALDRDFRLPGDDFIASCITTLPAEIVRAAHQLHIDQLDERLTRREFEMLVDDRACHRV